ncbi:hypothetical protein [Oligosphaera ethanolica]|uniref:Uncharacterized protein n=1 Tax=Oligosphaera ethanolica TaxID=760260 RepID=A0AAE4ARN5_9BACT|nr:hypothetical protein [Oligosphaera ethanolica]MDQ0291687.1 hypothetical protein [Oligosphaera ethanolica]
MLFVVARGFFYPQITQINADFFWGGLFFIRRFCIITQIGAGFFGGMSCRCASSHAAGRKARKIFSHAKARRREEEGKEDFFSREGAKKTGKMAACLAAARQATPPAGMFIFRRF